MKKLTVVTINYNTPAMTEKVIRHFQDLEKDLDADIIVIDNNSKDKVDPAIFTPLGVKLIFNPANLGFAKASNQGITATDSEYVLLLNSDVFVEPGAVSQMIKYMEENKKIGIMGPMMVFPDGRFQPSFGVYPSLKSEIIRFSHLYKYIPGSTFAFDTKRHPIDKTRVREVEWLTGGCLLLRRQMLDEIGLLDEEYFLGVEDFDICCRARRAGWKVIYYPLVKVAHHHGYSSGGTRSTLRIRMDRDGFDRFLRKFYPERKVSRYLVRLMHNVKIVLINILNKF